MISEFNAAKSCLQKLKAYADSKGFNISIQGLTASFEVDEIYLQETYLSSDNYQGINNNSSQIQMPIYQVAIHTPKKFGKWKGLEIYEELADHFERISDISLNDSQQVRIEQVNKVELPATDTHNLVVASVNLRLIG